MRMIEITKDNSYICEDDIFRVVKKPYSDGCRVHLRNGSTIDGYMTAKEVCEQINNKKD